MLEIGAHAKLANQMMCIKVLHVYLKAATIPTFNYLVLIVWQKGQETMQNLKPVCGAS